MNRPELLQTEISNTKFNTITESKNRVRIKNCKTVMAL